MTIKTDTDLPDFAQLPTTYAIRLDNFSAISLTGEDKTKYLQGQVTCDVSALDEHLLTNGAHCNAKGKVFSVFRLINREDALLLLQNKSSITSSLAELQKFGVFAKVTITETQQLSYLALVGEQAANLLQQQFGTAPEALSPVIQHGSSTLVYIAGQTPRYILIDSAEKITAYLQQFDLPTYRDDVWQLLEITEGFPTLSTSHIDEFVPQMLNVQAIGGISFNKGCYLGQETVARMQYLGKNKRALFALSGNSETAFTVGDIIEKQLGENWRRAGEVISSYQATSGKTYLQAVLNNDVTHEDSLRMKNSENVELNILALPYSLT